MLLASSTSPRASAATGVSGADRLVSDVLRVDLVSVIWKWSLLRLLEGVRRTRTLGWRSAAAELAPLLPPSNHSMRNEVWERLGLWPRVLMVTGVPSSGSEYEDLPSTVLDTSVASSVGVVESVSVGAGSGRTEAFFESTPMVVLMRPAGLLGSAKTVVLPASSSFFPDELLFFRNALATGEERERLGEKVRGGGRGKKERDSKKSTRRREK